MLGPLSNQRGNHRVSAHSHAHIVQLGHFQTAAFLADAAARAGAAPPRHPEAASTPCQCQAPEPCWSHDPAIGVIAVPATVPMLAVRPDVPPADPVDAAAEALEPAAAARPVLAGMTAPSVCQCIAPEPCRVHPDDRPWLRRPPLEALPAAGGVLDRLDRRPEPGGAHLEVEARCRLPRFTDEDVVMLARLIDAEHHRRRSGRRRGAHRATPSREASA